MTYTCTPYANRVLVITKFSHPDTPWLLSRRLRTCERAHATKLYNSSTSPILLCCVHYTLTSSHVLHCLLCVGIGDVLVRTIPQEFDMIDPIELNLIRPNIQDIFCRASAEFAQDIDEPLCHHKGIESRAKANFILAGAYTNAAMTAMGYPGRLLSPQASRCVRAYSTQSYASYSRHVDSLSCTLHSLQCQVKPALLALQSTAEMIDRVRLLIHSEQFPGPRCKQALMDLTVCPYCAGMQAVPPCLSSCKHVLRTCLSEVMNDQLHEIFLPVISNSLNRLQTILASISDNLIQARKTIQKVILEANQDVTNRLDHRQLKEEVGNSSLQLKAPATVLSAHDENIISLRGLKEHTHTEMSFAKFSLL